MVFLGRLIPLMNHQHKILAHTNSRYEAFMVMAGSSLGHNHGPIIITVTKNAKTLNDLIRKNRNAALAKKL